MTKVLTPRDVGVLSTVGSAGSRSLRNCPEPPAQFGKSREERVLGQAIVDESIERGQLLLDLAQERHARPFSRCRSLVVRPIFLGLRANHWRFEFFGWRLLQPVLEIAE